MHTSNLQANTIRLNYFFSFNENKKLIHLLHEVFLYKDSYMYSFVALKHNGINDNYQSLNSLMKSILHPNVRSEDHYPEFCSAMPNLLSLSSISLLSETNELSLFAKTGNLLKLNVFPLLLMFILLSQQLTDTK